MRRLFLKRWLLILTALFALLILLIVIGADADRLPRLVQYVYDFPGGDKAGHFFLFGILSFLLNKSALNLFPERDPARLVPTVSLLLAILF
jgi:hypothetical protein